MQKTKVLTWYFASLFSRFAFLFSLFVFHSISHQGWPSREKSKNFVVYFFTALIKHEIRMKYKKFIASISYYMVCFVKTFAKYKIGKVYNRPYRVHPACFSPSTSNLPKHDRFLAGKDENKRKGESALMMSMPVRPHPTEASFPQNSYGMHSSRDPSTQMFFLHRVIIPAENNARRWSPSILVEGWQMMSFKFHTRRSIAESSPRHHPNKPPPKTPTYGFTK